MSFESSFTFKAIASMLGTPIQGLAVAMPNPFTVLTPIRRPVNEPGPVPTTNPSTLSIPNPERSNKSLIFGTRSAACFLSQATVSSAINSLPLVNAMLKTLELVSMPKILNPYLPFIPALDYNLHGNMPFRQNLLHLIRPLYNTYTVAVNIFFLPYIFYSPQVIQPV